MKEEMMRSVRTTTTLRAAGQAGMTDKSRREVGRKGAEAWRVPGRTPESQGDSGVRPDEG
jgi:hypothetical protein